MILPIQKSHRTLLGWKIPCIFKQMALVISKLGYNWLIDLQFVFCDENTYNLFFKKPSLFTYACTNSIDWWILMQLQFVFCDENTYNLFFKKNPVCLHMHAQTQLIDRYWCNYNLYSVMKMHTTFSLEDQFVYICMHKLGFPQFHFEI